MTTRPALATAVLIGFLSIPTAPLTEETVSTLTLDGLTFIPFGDQEILPIPSGAKIRVTTDETSPRSARFEQRLRLIGIAHGGLSMVIDAYGQRERVLPHDEYAHARVEVRPEPAPDLAGNCRALNASFFGRRGCNVGTQAAAPPESRCAGRTDASCVKGVFT